MLIPPRYGSKLHFKPPYLQGLNKTYIEFLTFIHSKLIERGKFQPNHSFNFICPFNPSSYYTLCK